MNHMNDVAKLLGVEMNTEFEVDNYYGAKLRLTEYGAEICILGEWEYSTAACIMLQQLLNGQHTVKKHV